MIARGSVGSRGGRKVEAATKGQREGSSGDKNGLYLDCINVSILAVLLY